MFSVQVLKDPSVSRDVLKSRAKGLKKLGTIFQVSTAYHLPSVSMKNKNDVSLSHRFNLPLLLRVPKLHTVGKTACAMKKTWQ